MADEVNTREARSLMETENAAAANDNVADVNAVDAVAAGELSGASELLALLNDGDEQATNADSAGGELKANIAQKILISTSNLMQPLKFPLAHKGKLLFFPKKCTAADEHEELSIRARVQRFRQKLIGVQQPHKQLENFETEMEPVENTDFPFRRRNFGTKFPVKYMQNLQCLWPKAQTPTSHNEVAMKKTSNKKLNLESCRKLCEKKANISDKATIEQQVEPNNDFRTRSQRAEMFSATKTASKPMLTFASSSSSLDIAVTTRDADSNNELCIKSGSDICLATQLTHVISSTTADSKFPLKHRKHGCSDKFPLGSRLVEPQAPHHANIVDLPTLPHAKLRQQCINNNNNSNNAVKKNFPHAHSHFPTALKGAVCTSFPLTHSTAMPPTLISVYNVENQSSNTSSAENNTDIAATMTQSEILYINRTAHHVREHTPLALETHTETSANTQQAQRHTQNDAGGGDGDGSNNVLPKIFAKNTQICKQPSESSKFDGRSTENLTDADEERPHRAAITPPVCGAAAGARAPRERARAETDNAGGSIPSDSGHTNFHNLSQPPATLHAASSDVRDTSSQEVLLLVAANVSAALETCTATENASATPNPVPTPTSARPPAAAPSNSPNLAFLSDCAENASVAAHEFDKSDKAVVIANNNNHKNNGENINNQHKNNSETYKNNNNKNNSVSNAKNNDESNNTNNHINDSPSNAKNGDIDNSADVASPHIHLQDATIVGVRGDIEMTLTKVEDSEEDNLSVSSSVVDDIQKLSDIDQPADDMRIEMKSANKGASNLSASSTLRGSSHTPLHAPAHTYNRNHTDVAPDSRTYSPGALLHHAKPELSRYAKIEPRSVPTVARTPPFSGAYERNDSGDVGSVLAAATDVTKLANFGKSRRTANAVSRTPSADAAMDSSVLPARTLMRRQRRMLSQHSEDKPEDALERLNRLKARISASLSEVKGVLKHYSVDEGDESQALTSATAKKTPSAETLRKATATTTSLKQTASVESADLIKSVAANKASQSSSAVRNDVEKQVQSEPPKDEGPVVFRFVKIVRRRSFFSEDDDEAEVDTRSAEEKSNAEQIGAVSNHKMDEKETRGGVNQHEDHIKQDEASDKNVQKNDDRTEEDRRDITKEIKELSQRKDITQAQGLNKAEESSAVEHRTLDGAYKTANQALDADKLKVKEVTNEPKKNQEAPKTGDVVKTRKRSSLTKKDDARRASIAAVEASKIEPPLKPEAALDVKLQRCPSDSEAVLKKKAAAVKSLTSKKAEANNATKLHLPNAAEMPIKPPVEFTNQLPSKPGVELDTVKEEKSSGQSEEFSTESKAKEAKNEVAASQETETEANAKPKRRLSTRTKDSTRRASIAAVEGSHVEPPVEASTPLNAKTQRRPSDSEAIIKRKAFATSGQTRVKIITKVKRPSVKSNASAVAPTTTTAVAVSANETTLVNEISAPVANNSNKDAVSQISKTTTKAAALKKATMTTTTQPTVTATASTNNTATPTPLPKQLAIDEASLSIAKAPQPSTSPTDDHIAATKDSRLATKLDEQSGAMVATLASPLRASDQSGQVSAATQLQQLAELVGETLIVIPTRNRKDEAAVKQVGTRQSESSTAAERADGAVVPVKTEAPIAVIPKIPETLATPTTSPQPPADVEKPIHQEKIPTNAVQVRTTSEQVSGVDRERAPKAAVVADASITPRTATGGDRTKASATPSSSISVDEHSVASTPATATESAMPELQVVPAPVKAVQVFGETDATPPFNVPKDDYAPKKVTIKKFVRRNSIEKALAKQKSIEKAAEAQSQKKIVSDSVTVSNDVQPEPDAAIANEAVTAIVAGDEAPAVDEPSAPAPPPKKARKVRKKVIIKRQQRKLSITDAFFKEPEPSEAELPAVETLEKPIEYVTDEDEDNAENVEPEVEPVKPLKSCLRQREYQIGDWVLYGERFKKTQIRWKKGTIVERITSISYKIDIDGKEVSAHISYIKKYTSRKVKFSGKEYLEIDYEQIAEEEKRARTYSIWNMV